MSKISEKVVVGLPGTKLKAFYLLERADQQEPCIGDMVQVRGEIVLPHDKEGYLEPELRFGTRASVAKRVLWKEWGEKCPTPGGRRQDKLFPAKTWHEAFGDARAWCQVELQKLTDALRIRQQRLEEAEARPDILVNHLRAETEPDTIPNDLLQENADWEFSEEEMKAREEEYINKHNARKSSYDPDNNSIKEEECE